MKLCASLVSAVIILSSAVSATHAQLYWDIDGAIAGAGGATPTGTWDTSLANWNLDPQGDGDAGGGTTWTAGGDAIFSAGTDASGAFTVTLSGTQTANSILFQDGTVTLAGAQLDLVDSGSPADYNADGTVNAGDYPAWRKFPTLFGNDPAGYLAWRSDFGAPGGGSGGTITTATGTTSTISSVIGGSVPLTKEGADRLVLSGANVYTGGTNVNVGTLQFGDSDCNANLWRGSGRERRHVVCQRGRRWRVDECHFRRRLHRRADLRHRRTGHSESNHLGRWKQSGYRHHERHRGPLTYGGVDRQLSRRRRHYQRRRPHQARDRYARAQRREYVYRADHVLAVPRPRYANLLKTVATNTLPSATVLALPASNGNAKVELFSGIDADNGTPFNQTIAGLTGGGVGLTGPTVVDVGYSTLTLNIPSGETNTYNGFLKASFDQTDANHVGKVIINGPGELILGGNSNDPTYRFGGQLIANGGRLGFSGNNALGGSTGTSRLILNNGATLVKSNAATASLNLNVRTLDINGSFTMDMTGAQADAALVTGAVGIGIGGINLNADATITVTAPVDPSFPTGTPLGFTPAFIPNGPITDGTNTYNFTKAGDGLLTLNRPTGYSGTTTITGGTLRLSSVNATSPAATLGDDPTQNGVPVGRHAELHRCAEQHLCWSADDGC